MVPREKKARQTRDIVLDAAIDLFVAQGFETTSMDAIAMAAKVAKGTLYYYFQSKEGIVDAIVERYAQTMETRLSAVAADRHLGFTGKLAAFVAAMKEINSATFARLHHVRYIDIHQKTAAVMVDRFAPYLARLIGEGNRVGQCRVDRPLEYAEIIIAASQALLDPEVGAEKLPRRIEAFASLTASIFNMSLRECERIYRPLAGGQRGRRETGSGDPARSVQAKGTTGRRHRR